MLLLFMSFETLLFMSVFLYFFFKKLILLFSEDSLKVSKVSISKCLFQLNVILLTFLCVCVCL